MPDPDPPPLGPRPVAREPAEPDTGAPRDVSGLIGPTLVGMVAGVAIVLLLLWLR